MKTILENHVMVNSKLYEYSWLDFTHYVRLTVFHEGRVVGKRNLPIRVDRGINMIQYLIKRMELGHVKNIRQSNN